MVEPSYLVYYMRGWIIRYILIWIKGIRPNRNYDGISIILILYCALPLPAEGLFLSSIGRIALRHVEAKPCN